MPGPLNDVNDYDDVDVDVGGDDEARFLDNDSYSRNILTVTEHEVCMCGVRSKPSGGTRCE